MYVCLCNSVSDRDIRDAVSDGVSSMRGLGAQLGVASRCGKCAPLAREVLLSQLAHIPRELEAAEQAADPTLEDSEASW